MFSVQGRIWRGIAKGQVPKLHSSGGVGRGLLRGGGRQKEGWSIFFSLYGFPIVFGQSQNDRVLTFSPPFFVAPHRHSISFSYRLWTVSKQSSLTFFLSFFVASHGHPRNDRIRDLATGQVEDAGVLLRLYGQVRKIKPSISTVFFFFFLTI